MGWFTAAGTFGLVAEYFLKTTAVLALALLAAAAARRRPAAFRHFVMSFALIGLLLLPVLSLAPLGWRTALLPGRPAATKALPPLRIAPGLPTAAATEAAEVQFFVSRLRPAEAATERPPVEGIVLSREPSSPPLSAAAPFASRARRSMTPASVHGRLSLDIALAVLWSAGLAFLVLKLAVGLAAAVKLTAEGEALTDALWRVILERFLALMPLQRTVRLKSHPEIRVPLTWGWRRPVILMPAGMEGWTEEERSSALFHELSHIKRADFLVMLLVRTSLAVFWWNPLCWVVYRGLRREQEIACDELVLRAGIKPSTYAASLLAFRRSAGLRWSPSAALLGMLGRSSFSERLAAILRQRLTFKEVKMRTKIMLAGAVVLAVAVIGTARPAVGIERRAATTTVVETALPAPAVLDAALPGADALETPADQTAVQEKEKEKAKAAEKAAKEKAEEEKAAPEKKVVITVKEHGKAPFELVITEGDVVKTLVLEKPLTITKSADGKALVLSSEGKEVQVLTGEPLRLEIKGAKLEVIKEGQALKIDEGGFFKIAKETGKEGSHVFIYKGKEPGVEVGEIRIDAKPRVGRVTVEGGKKGLWVAKESSGKSAARAVWIGEGDKAFSIYPAGGKELLEKVHQLQEQVEAIKAKKMDITALEESLKKIEAELQAKEEKLKEVTVELGEVEGELTVGKAVDLDKAEGKRGIWIYEGGKAKKIDIGVERDENEIRIIDIDKGTTEKDYERVVARLKKDLPEGYTLAEQEFDAESGTMRFKIAPPEGQKTDKTLVYKLVESLKDELKNKK